MIKQSIASLAIVAAFASFGAQAATDAYVTNSTNVSEANPEGVVKNGIGECWQTGSWTAEKAKTVKGCPGYVEPTVAAPAPAPTPVAPKPAPVAVKKQFTLKADTLFAFDKATLTPAGKDALDKLVGEVKDLDPKDGSAIIVGYTDRLGSDKYNQALSERRAEAVKAYLVSQGAPEAALKVEGRGKANPVTGNACDEIKNTKKTRAKLIECLANDRRVEIEVNGVTVETVQAK